MPVGSKRPARSGRPKPPARKREPSCGAIRDGRPAREKVGCAPAARACKREPGCGAATHVGRNGVALS